jgi:hypothetical protein
MINLKALLYGSEKGRNRRGIRQRKKEREVTRDVNGGGG